MIAARRYVLALGALAAAMLLWLGSVAALLWASLSPAERDIVASRLAQGPRVDIGLIADRLRQQINPTVATAGWKIYDRYLKTNRVEAGTRSYGEVIELVLSTRFGKDWTVPLR